MAAAKHPARNSSLARLLPRRACLQPLQRHAKLLQQ